MERNWVEEESRAVVMKIGILYFYRDKSEMSKGMALSTRFLVLNEPGFFLFFIFS